MRVAHRLITINKNCIVQSSGFATSACLRWPRAPKDDRRESQKWKQYLDDKDTRLEQSDDVVAETRFGTIRLDSMNVKANSTPVTEDAYTYSAKPVPFKEANQEVK